MKINTKYNLKDEVWVMLENKACRCQVEGMRISVFVNSGAKPNYYLTDRNGHDVKQGGYSDGTFPEHHLYKTKEDLLKTI